MTIPDERLTFADPELRALDGALRDLAAETLPRPAFLEATITHLRRETARQQIPTPTRAAHTAGARPVRSSAASPRPTWVASRREDRAGRADRPPQVRTAPPLPAGRPLTRRHFLIGSATAAVAATAAVLHGRQRSFSPAPPLATAAPRLTNITAAMISVGEPTPVAASALVQPRNLDFADALNGWGLWGERPQDYTYGIDPHVAQAGRVSAYLANGVADPQGFGTLAQTFLPDPWRGLRIRMSADVKAENVADWAGLWMRLDGPGNQSLSFDNMQGRPITGTRDWAQYTVVLDAPVTAAAIAFGVLLQGKGKVWLADVQFATVGADVPVTSTPATG